MCDHFARWWQHSGCGHCMQLVLVSVNALVRLKARQWDLNQLLGVKSAKIEVCSLDPKAYCLAYSYRPRVFQI